MSAQTRGLGKGLGALIPTTGASVSHSQEPEAAEHGGVLSVRLDQISPNPHQPRSAMDQESLAELAASIREHGLIQPLIVTRAGDGAAASYILIAGERRWRAAQLIGLATIPVILKEATPQQQLELALVENIQRSDLSPLEEADAYRALMSEFGLSQQAVADRVGKSRVAVANAVRLLRLPERVKELVAHEKLSEGHARALLGLSDDEMLVRAAEQVVARDLTVRQTEELVRRLQVTVENAASAGDEDEEDKRSDPFAVQTKQLESAFREALGTKVMLSRGRRGGRLVISFFSEEELQTIYERIVGSM